MSTPRALIMERRNGAPLEGKMKDGNCSPYIGTMEIEGPYTRPRLDGTDAFSSGRPCSHLLRTRAMARLPRVDGPRYGNPPAQTRRPAPPVIERVGPGRLRVYAAGRTDPAPAVRSDSTAGSD